MPSFSLPSLILPSSRPLGPFSRSSGCPAPTPPSEAHIYPSNCTRLCCRCPRLPTLGALYRTTHLRWFPRPAHCVLPHSFASSSSSIHLPMFVPALCATHRRPTRPLLFAPSACSYPPCSRPQCHLPLAHLPAFVPSAPPTTRSPACVCALSAACCLPPTPVLQYLFLQSYLPTVLHNPGTSPTFLYPGTFHTFLPYLHNMSLKIHSEYYLLASVHCVGIQQYR
jgi:hypothetical protein